MVDKCSSFAKSRNLTFGTDTDPKKSKTKSIIFSKKLPKSPMPIVLDGNDLPWVTSLVHLGCTLQSENNFNQDMVTKRRKFNGIVNSLLQEFYYASPEVIMKFINVYACCFYGSQCWHIFSSQCNRIFTTWNVTIRKALNLNKTTHRFLKDPWPEKFLFHISIGIGCLIT